MAININTTLALSRVLALTFGVALAPRIARTAHTVAITLTVYTRPSAQGPSTKHNPCRPTVNYTAPSHTHTFELSHRSITSRPRDRTMPLATVMLSTTSGAIAWRGTVAWWSASWWTNRSFANVSPR